MASPPTDILEILGKLDIEMALEPGDPRYVETAEARGSTQTAARLARKFGLRLSDGAFYPPPKKHVLFFGHTGTGKTTELRRYCSDLEVPDRYLVIEVRVAELLDRNNFEYTDLVMALAKSLVDRLAEKDVALPGDAVAGLERWFAESVKTESALNEFAATVEAGAKGKVGFPLIGSVFARFTTALRTNATYKTELRRVVRNTYSQFAAGFNELLREAEARAFEASVARRFLFVVDGTDKLRGSDTRRFFIERPSPATRNRCPRHLHGTARPEVRERACERHRSRPGLAVDHDP